MQPPGFEGLLPPPGFSTPQPRGLLAASPPPALSSAFPQEGAPEPQKPPPGSAPLPYGYFGSGYYSCRVARSAIKAPAGAAGGFGGDKYEKFLEAPAAPGEDFQREFAAFYPSYGGHYQPVAGYLDVSVVPGLGGAGEARHEALLPADGYHQPPWAIGGGWGGQVCCGKEQSQPGYLLKAAFADPAAPLPPEGCSFRRGRKKRVPYSKAQLKELEKEFQSSKFITRDKRRRISAATSLSERQITIWFQNRRVKEKKVAAKVKGGAAGTA